MTTSAAQESEQEHTRILRVMLAVDDCVAYWRRSSRDNEANRARIAFDERWFGSKSESRVRTLLGDMQLRFEAYPCALQALREWNPPRELAPWLCHFHTQLADPIYRRFTGEYLPTRRAQGHSSVDRDAVARWIADTWPSRWAAVTCIKFGGNLLSTAYEAGLMKERRDPRRLIAPRVPPAAVEYLLYLLREVRIASPILRSPYLTALAANRTELGDLLAPLSAVRVLALDNVVDFTWSYPDLMSWAKGRREAA